MSDLRTIRRVTLEFLRAGPPHNQLLSPLTAYLAVCGEAGATVVHVEWEHAQFLRRIEEMRYERGTDEDPPRRLAVLDELGGEVAKFLGKIPALAGVLGGEAVEGEILHLRLVLSASELGLVPYELSKVPTGLQLPAEHWLLLQANTPVCMTRHVRGVPYRGIRWDRPARVLFVASDPAELPYEEHLEALVDAVRPWLHPGQEKPTPRKMGEDRRAYHYGDILTVMPDARIQDVQALCEKDTYTHVHVLAHGGVDDTSERLSYGIGLHGEIVTGRRFASAVTSPSDRGIDRPVVVTLASCDSANIGSVMSAGASFAHALHQAGIPMVVASQFPLSFEGSLTGVQRMYGERDGFLWGHNPLFMLQQLRRSLQITNEPTSHDWASIVVYEALPPELEDQLVHYEHNQAARGLKASEALLKRVEKMIPSSSYEEIDKALSSARGACTRACGEFADHGPYATEALALRGANYKKLAEVEYQLAMKPRLGTEKRRLHLDRCHKALDHSYERYRNAVAGMLNPKTGSQHKAQLHYVCVQMLALGTLLGKEEVTNGYWQIALLSARAHARLPEDEERAWALGTLMELHLLGVADPTLGPHPTPAPYKAEAVRSATELVDLFPKRGEFPVYSTYRQLGRYTHWWGAREFKAHLEREGVVRPWDVDDAWAQLVEVAGKLQEVLEPRLWKNQVEK